MIPETSMNIHMKGSKLPPISNVCIWDLRKSGKKLITLQFSVSCFPICLQDFTFILDCCVTYWSTHITRNVSYARNQSSLTILPKKISLKGQILLFVGSTIKISAMAIINSLKPIKGKCTAFSFMLTKFKSLFPLSWIHFLLKFTF